MFINTDLNNTLNSLVNYCQQEVLLNNLDDFVKDIKVEMEDVIFSAERIIKVTFITKETPISVWRKISLGTLNSSRNVLARILSDFIIEEAENLIDICKVKREDYLEKIHQAQERVKILIDKRIEEEEVIVTKSQRESFLGI